MLDYLLPWEFSFSWAFALLAAAVLYLRGLRSLRRQGRPVGVWRSVAFLVGIAAMYAVTETQYDYLSRFMFFAHRAQHVVLHHAAPFLIALAVPWPVLAAGVPPALRQLRLVRDVAPLLRWAYRVLQHPIVAPVLFVGLIYFWLTPEIHFDAMLNRTLYHVMNWSMALDGVLFWWLMLDRRSQARGGLGYGWRIAILIAVVPPQLALGAYITFSERVLFDVYSVCGRAWPIDPLADQTIGGLITWIPPSMMSVVGVLIVLGYILRRSNSAVGEPGLQARRESDATV